MAATPVLFAGCGDPCERAVAKGPPATAASICERLFSETGRIAAGLAALKAHAAAKDVPAATALAARLEERKAGVDVSFVMGELYETTRDPRAAATLARAVDGLSVAGDHARASQAARAKSRADWRSSRYHDSLTALDRALSEAEAAHAPGLAGRAFLSLFTVLYELGDLHGARRALREAEARSGSLEPAMAALIGFDRGLLATAEGNPKSARVALESLLQSGMAPPESEVGWNARLNLLAIALDDADQARAAREWAAAKPVFETKGFRTRAASRVTWALRSAQLALLEGNPERALTLLDAAIAEGPSPEWMWTIHLERGHALKRQGRTTPAEAAYRASIAVIEDLRGEQFDDFKSWVMAQRRAPYVALFDLLLGRGDIDAAVDVFERTQGRTFLEAFAAAAMPGPGDQGPTAADQRVQYLRRLYPALRSSAVIPANATPVDQLRAALGRDHVVGFFEADARLHVVVLAQGKTRVVTAPRSLPEIRTLVTRLLENPGDAATAVALRQALFPPGTLPPPTSAGTTRIFLVPSPALASLPFAALRRAAGAPGTAGLHLAQEYVLAEVPSMTALVALRQAPAATSHAAPAVFADATGDLPAAKAEARVVAGHLGATTRTFVGDAVTSAQLRAVGRPSVLHFAVHSGLGAQGAWLGLRDRQVFAGELMDWRVGAELVVLASCASSATRDPGQWGSLVASFLATGTPNVIGSLWSTKDVANQQFVARFYAEGGSADPALAVARAQRAWIAEGRDAQEWSAYVAFGAAAVSPSTQRERSRANPESVATRRSP